jgi:protein TonB
MRVKPGFLVLGLAALLAGSGAAMAPRASAQEATSAPDTATKRKVRTKVLPEYPPLAKQIGLAGKAKIEATITADGQVVSTRVVGGSPLLVNAAVEALKKWRFEPAPKETTEVIEFEFGK